ncbi:MAG: four helix bundle protein [Deltaproteobacteria bacterium]|nr:four helix bundle protein [Deltaproteobacteria bacterium]
MHTDLEHEKTIEYRAAYDLQQYVTQTLQARRGLGTIRAQLDGQLVRVLLSIAEALARPKHPDFLRLLDKADASCVRVATLLHLLYQRGVATVDELDHARSLVQELRKMLDRHLTPTTGDAVPDQAQAASSPAAPANGSFVVPSDVGFRPSRKRTAARPTRRARLQ